MGLIIAIMTAAGVVWLWRVTGRIERLAVPVKPVEPQPLTLRSPFKSWCGHPHSAFMPDCGFYVDSLLCPDCGAITPGTTLMPVPIDYSKLIFASTGAMFVHPHGHLVSFEAR